MVDGFVQVLRQHSEIALFLTLAVGYVLGKVRLAGHELGLVTGALFGGLLIGQLAIDVRPEIKTIFLLLFLFANGYGAGPQFFRALKQEGVAPLLLTLVVCFTGLFMVWLMSRIMHLDIGFSAGLLSGSLTQSSAIGTATDAIMGLPLPLERRTELVNQVPIADAVCYLFGFWGEVFFVAAILPKLMGIDLERAAKALDAKLGIDEEAPMRSAYTAYAARALRLTTQKFRTVEDLESEFSGIGQRVSVFRLRRRDAILEANPSTALLEGDVIAIGGRRTAVMRACALIGSEQDDAALLAFPIDSGNVIITNRSIENVTIGELASTRNFARGLFATRLMRGSQEIPIGAQTTLQQGDVLSLIGDPAALAGTAEELGYWERPSVVTDILTLGLGIAIGCLIGLPALIVGGVKLSLSTSVGTLLAGLFFGWLRSQRPWIIGNIPEASRLFLVNFGLAGFVAITGLHAGPEFIGALKSVGLSLFFAGIICTCVPPLVGVMFGKYVLRMDPLLLLGGVAGAQTMTAAMVAVQERAKSKAPVIGFTVPYALGNIILTTFGTVIVLLLS